MQEKTITADEKYVEDRLQSAARTLRKLPLVRAQGYRNAWPEIFRDKSEIMRMEKEPMRVRPSPKDISEMEEIIFNWTGWLTADEHKLVWLRAERVPWKLICYQLGCGRTKAWEMYKVALAKISAKLR